MILLLLRYETKALWSLDNTANDKKRLKALIRIALCFGTFDKMRKTAESLIRRGQGFEISIPTREYFFKCAVFIYLKATYFFLCSDRGLCGDRQIMSIIWTPFSISTLGLQPRSTQSSALDRMVALIALF